MKLGYVQHRTNLLHPDSQSEKLIEYGVDKEHIYDQSHGIDEAINSCREGDELVVYSAIVIGAHAYAKYVKKLADINCNLYIIRKSLLIDCKAGKSVAEGALDIKQHNEQLGKLYGRKKKYDASDVSKVVKFVVEEGNSQKEAAKFFNINETLISRMVNGDYLKTSRKSA